MNAHLLVDGVCSSRSRSEDDGVAVSKVAGHRLHFGNTDGALARSRHIQLQRFVDVAVDQGGCGETTKVTYHDDPIFIEDGVVHYCVGNMPGAVPRTSTIALTNATLSYGLQIAGKGLEQACKDNEVIYSAINTYDGKLTCKNVADSFECYEYTDIKSVC